ncbi:hypothetical protein [Giesbergeria anulus]|uniref:Uncharacterized protein n=1 Tax=Giesbergeria anulus TaxID=180197 RepID=A0A1H9E796_9BURK|nr:hypothetical protein [Giesbergeria anulus]SEQ21624.1 hypothetical protein SAMN02982919_00220 [Giesbergeria anulus]
MGLIKREKVLILAKTHPSPSAQYMETSCIAGINEDGLMRRLYPVPFRMLGNNQQFKKWQWIEVQVEKAIGDHRAESHKIYIDSISCGDIISPKNEWKLRQIWIEKIPILKNFDILNMKVFNDGPSIGLLKPKEIIKLEITKSRNQDWTKEEKEKLVRSQMQGNFFSEFDATKQVRELQKIPFDFYYHYTYDSPEGEKSYKNKIVDWEAGALFWNCRASHGINWETPFRDKLESHFSEKRDLMFLMGNQHRFQDQWLIISLIYPPKQMPSETENQCLLF